MTRIPLEEDDLFIAEGIKHTHINIHTKSHKIAQQLKAQILQDAEKAQRLYEAIELWNSLLEEGFKHGESCYMGAEESLLETLQKIRDGAKV